MILQLWHMVRAVTFKPKIQANLAVAVTVHSCRTQDLQTVMLWCLLVGGGQSQQLYLRPVIDISCASAGQMRGTSRLNRRHQKPQYTLRHLEGLQGKLTLGCPLLLAGGTRLQGWERTLLAGQTSMQAWTACQLLQAPPLRGHHSQGRALGVTQPPQRAGMSLLPGWVLFFGGWAGLLPFLMCCNHWGRSQWL